MALINTFFLQNSVCEANGAINMLKFSKLFCGFNYLIQICTRSQGNKFVADFKYMLMQELTKRQEKELRNAYFSAIKVTGEGYNGEYFRGNYPNIEECFKESYIEWLNEFKFELDYSIEEIKKINNEINKIEKAQILDDEFSIESEFKLIKLKKLLTDKINNL